MTENELHDVADGAKTQSGAQLDAFCRNCTLNTSTRRLIAIVCGIPRVGRKGDAVGRHQVARETETSTEREQGHRTSRELY
jgi:hypothetical protein